MERSEMENVIETYPDLIAEAQSRYELAEEERKMIYANKYYTLTLEHSNQKTTTKFIEAMILRDPEHHSAKIKEIMAHEEYTRLNEKLMAAKKLCDHRTAF
jgi:hypothetical protein